MRNPWLRLGVGLLAGGLLGLESQAQERPSGALPNTGAVAVVSGANASQPDLPRAGESDSASESGSTSPFGLGSIQATRPLEDTNGNPLVFPNGVYAPSCYHWIEADLLLWWLKGASVPPLLSSSPPGTPRNQAGVLGTPGAQVLFGGDTYNNDMLPGGRFTLGAWLDEDKTLGVEMYGIVLPGGCSPTSYTAGTPGVVSRPFVDANTGRNASELVSYPGILDGSSTASISTCGLYGAGVVGLLNVAGNENYRIDALGGFRYLSICDKASVTENLTSVDPNNGGIPVGTTFGILDQFKTGSQFYGCDVGLRGEYRMSRRWFVDGTGRIALGSTYQSCEINGSTTVTTPGGVASTSPGGLLALPSNIGSYSREVLTFVPEVGVHVGYFLTERVRLKAGYTFLYWSSVARAGNVIDPVVNTNSLPPAGAGALPARPAFNWNGTGVWAQGIDLGLEWRF